MNKVFSITGPSGVGKSTISKILAICLGHEKSIIVSCDDSHLWERNNENWKFKTHLDPTANNLSQELEHLKALKKNKPIKRILYDHSTGDFTKPVQIIPKSNIIYEGLHTMHDSLSNLSDISFYIEVEDAVKREWKILRDSRKRGYSIEQVVEVMDRRREDEKKYIEPQKKKCDVIIRFNKTLNNEITLEFEYADPSLANLINDIKKLYELLQNFIKVSKTISQNTFLSQNKGGNLSFRFKDVVIATESGSSFGKISYFDGFGFYELNGKSIFQGQKRPSMEIGCHLKLGPCCLHTHPLHLMAIICSDECDEIIEEIFDDIKVIDYISPGPETRDAITYHKNIIVKNHGIFVSRDNLMDCLQYSLDVDQICKEYLEKRSVQSSFLFPDAYVLEQENLLYHYYVKGLIAKANLSEKSISYENLRKLEEMEEEKYRKLIS